MTQTTPETARALLDRHGLSEDVIDGALCLHAQELAALQRNDAQARHDRSYSDNRVFELKGARTAADLIDPTKGAAVSAVMGPPADRADLRARISEGLRNARRNGLGGMTEAEAVAHMAAAILAVLPEQADRAAVLSDVERQFLTYALDLAADQMASRGAEFGAEDQAAMETLRRLAVEAHDTGTQQQDAAPTSFVLWLDASDGSVPTHDGIQWPDGTTTIHHRHFGITTTHHDPEAARRAAHGEQGRIVWPHTVDEPAPVAQQPAAEVPGPWLVQKICCGRDDGIPEFATWEAADSFRETYIDSARVAGHERSAIVRRKDAPATEQQAAAADGEETPSTDQAEGQS